MQKSGLSVFEIEILKVLEKVSKIEKSKLEKLFLWSDEELNAALSALLEKNLIKLEAVSDGLFEELFIIKMPQKFNPIKKLISFQGKSFKKKLELLKENSFKPKELINFKGKSKGA